MYQVLGVYRSLKKNITNVFSWQEGRLQKSLGRLEWERLVRWQLCKGNLGNAFQVVTEGKKLLIGGANPSCRLHSIWLRETFQAPLVTICDSKSWQFAEASFPKGTQEDVNEFNLACLTAVTLFYLEGLGSPFSKPRRLEEIDPSVMSNPPDHLLKHMQKTPNNYSMSSYFSKLR